MGVVEAENAVEYMICSRVGDVTIWYPCDCRRPSGVLINCDSWAYPDTVIPSPLMKVDRSCVNNLCGVCWKLYEELTVSFVFRFALNTHGKLQLSESIRY